MTISKLSMSFVDGSTVIDANKMNAIVSKINELVDKANDSTSGGGNTDSGGGSDTPQPESRPNLFDASTQKEGIGLRSDNGEEAANGSVNCSDFIEVKPSTKYSWYVRYVVCWYDSDKTFISASTSTEAETRTLTSPSNAAFCRFSYLKTHLQFGEIVMKEGERDWL